jgi:hypothetical protein
MLYVTLEAGRKMGSSATPFLLAARPLLFLYGDSITQLGSKVFQFPPV